MRGKILLAAVSIIMAACTQDEAFYEDIERLGDATGTIIDTDSRTSLDENKSVIWSQGDQVSIFGKTGFHYCYNLKSGENTTSATFGFVETVGSSPRVDMNYAVYPFKASNSIDDNKELSLDLSTWSTQIYTEGTFPQGLAVMTGKSSNLNFPFYNAQALVRIRLNSVVPGSYSISSISLTSGSTALNGPAVIDLTEDKPALKFTGDLPEHMTNMLNCENPVLLVEETHFYMLIPAGVYQTLTITIQGTNEMDGTPLNFSTVLQNKTFPRSVITSLTKTFDPVEFSGSIEGTN